MISGTLENLLQAYIPVHPKKKHNLYADRSTGTNINQNIKSTLCFDPISSKITAFISPQVDSQEDDVFDSWYNYTAIVGTFL